MSNLERLVLCFFACVAPLTAFVISPTCPIRASYYPVSLRNARLAKCPRAADRMSVVASVGHGAVGRREAMVAAGRGSIGLVLGVAGAQTAGAKTNELVQRLESEKVQQLPADNGNQKDIEYPAWLEGTWQVTSILDAFRAPLGNKFLGGSSSAINDRSAAEAVAQTGKEVDYNLRFIKVKGVIREDRLFNQKERLDAFAGRPVVRRIQYVAIDRGEKTLELNTLVYFAGNTLVSGGLAGKTFSTRRRFATVDMQDMQHMQQPSFVAAENTRQLYAKKCEQTAETGVCGPPIVTDQEAVTLFSLQGDGQVVGKVRLLGYLNPQAPLFFDARQQAVTISDYSLTMRKEGAAVVEDDDHDNEEEEE